MTRTTFLRFHLHALLLGSFAQAALAQEIPVATFDTPKAKASYVVAIPTTKELENRPLILDFHGAARPSRKGANLTNERVWREFARRRGVLVAGLNGRTRAWGMTKGKLDDIAYAEHVLQRLRREYRPLEDEIYLAGFSSGADFLCKGDLQVAGKYAGSLVVCPGPPSVVGLRGGKLLRNKNHPFYFVAGENDYIRKDGAWQAFVALDQAGGKVMYREVPDVGHRFPPMAEYERAFRHLRYLAGKSKIDLRALVDAAFARGDYLMASTYARRSGTAKDQAILAAIRAKGQALLAQAEKIAWEKDPGRAYETWWQLQTQFHRFDSLAKRARAELTKKRGIQARDLYRARRKFLEGQGVLPRQKSKKKDGGKPPPRKRSVEERMAPHLVGAWSFDRYLTADGVQERLTQLAAAHPNRVRLTSMGRSIGGRPIPVVEISDRSVDPRHKPAIYVQGGIHGNEISSVMATLYFAWRLGANPTRRRGTDRLLRDVTLYVAPMVNPDAVQHFVSHPNTTWRPRFNFRPHDADGDGRIDEDGYEDLNGDGEIGYMYRADPRGDYVRDGDRMRRFRAGDTGGRYTLVAREGLDNDGDGRFSEDHVGGVNLNRNFPVGFRARRDFEGFRGPTALSEPETQAVVKFVTSHPNICRFFDVHNHADCVFYWSDAPQLDREDFSTMTAIASRARQALGHVPRPLNHSGVGLSIAWAYGKLGIPACILELAPGLGNAAQYLAEGWQGDVFQRIESFQHPQLGTILLGNDHKKLPKRNPHPRDIYAQADRTWQWLRDELKQLPKLVVEQPRVTRHTDGYRITGTVVNHGKAPMESARARRTGMSRPITITAVGGELDPITLAPLPPGGRRNFDVLVRAPQARATLVLAHRRAGRVEIAVRRPHVATLPIRAKSSYKILAGYRSVDTARRADNRTFRDGRPVAEHGPRFRLAHSKNTLRIGVLLGEFSDLRHTVPAQAFARSLFGANNGDGPRTSFTGQHVYGSLRDFYREMSYGKLEVTGRVFPWLELPGRYETYRNASFGKKTFRTALEAAVLARFGADALDGFDGLIFVWAGNPVHRVSNLWPMRLKLPHRKGVIAFKTGEFYRGQMAPIGVACHEMGHTFGVNDKYGLGAPPLPMGRWCLMCKGTHGAGASMQHRPFPFCAWCKSVIGWVHPVVIDPAQRQRLALRPILAGPNECYRILLKADGSEYLLLENRRREGFLTELPSPGLAILRVGPNTRPAAPQKQVALLPAHGKPPLRRSELADLPHVAWPQPGKTEITVAGVRIADIRIVDDVVYFEVCRSR